MDVSFLIRLIDQFTGPAQKIRNTAKGIGDAANDLKGGFADAIRKGFSTENIETATKNAEAKLSTAKEKLRGAVGLGLALVAPLKGLGDFEDRLINFGNVAGIYGRDLKSIEDELRRIGPTVNKTAGEMLTALEYLVGKGMKPDVALNAIKAIGMTATASKSEIEDMASSGYAVIDNLKVPAENLQLALDAMAEAGKRGGFELKSMADYFPGLTASAQMLGMDGVDAVAELAAALQVARKGSKDDAEAANNMQNFLSKLTSPETVKRFKEQNIDVQAEFKKAAKNGESVFEHMLKVIEKATNGDQFKMGDLFGDMQVLNFLKPMMANMDEFRQIREAAMKSSGVNEQDFLRAMEGLNVKTKALVIQFNNLLTAGSPLLDLAKELVSEFTAFIAQINDFAKANPELTRQIVLGVAALMSFAIAARLAGFALAWLRLPLIGLTSTFLKFNAQGRNIAIGWRLIAGAGRILGSALSLVRYAAVGLGSLLSGLTAPAWLAVAALVAAAFALWKYWDRVSSFLSGVGSVFGETFSAVVKSAVGLIDSLITKFGELLGFNPAEMAVFKAATWNAIGQALDFSAIRAKISEFWDWLGSFFSQEKLGEGEKAVLYESGRAMAQSLIDGIKDFINTNIQPIRDLFKFALEIEWPTPPAWVSWLVDKSKSAVSSAANWTQSLGTGDQPPAWAMGGAIRLPEKEINQTINAEVIDKRPPNMTVHAPISITGVVDPVAAGNAATARLGAAIANAKAGAMHGGTEE